MQQQLPMAMVIRIHKFIHKTKEIYLSKLSFFPKSCFISFQKNYRRSYEI
jgi:hypothetical protein